MVYSVRSDKPIILSAPLDTKRVQGEHSRKAEKFMKEHKVAVKTTSHSESIVVTEVRCD